MGQRVSEFTQHIMNRIFFLSLEYYIAILSVSVMALKVLIIYSASSLQKFKF